MPVGDLARTVTLVACGASALLLAFTAFVLRRESRATFRSPLLSMVSEAAVTFLYVALAGTPIATYTGAGALALGMLLGLGWGRATKLRFQGSTLLCRRDIRPYVIWSVAYLATALLPLLGSTILHALGIMALLFGLGVVLGSNLVLLVRQLIARPPKLQAQPG